jgi:hypothetical protein
MISVVKQGMPPRRSASLHWLQAATHARPDNGPVKLGSYLDSGHATTMVELGGSACVLTDLCFRIFFLSARSTWKLPAIRGRRHRGHLALFTGTTLTPSSGSCR